MADIFREETGRFAGASGVEIFFRRLTPVGKQVRAGVVVVHGLGEHSGRYTNLTTVLSQAGYAIYAADHQGFGQSGGRRGHVGRFTDYLPDLCHMVEMVRKDWPGCPVVMFGHSMGGLIALYYALEHPQDLNALIVSAPALLATPNPWLVRMMRMINWVQPTFVIRRPGDNRFISRDPEEVRRYDMDPLAVPVSSARWAVEILTAQKIVGARAAEIHLPILMVQGLADVVVVPQATLNFFAQVSSTDKTLFTYPDYFHELHNDIGKEKPLADVVEWLEQRV